MTARVPSERSFGLTVGVVCAAIGAFRWWRGHGSSGAVLAVVGAALVGAALVAPGALRIPNRIWWRIAQVLGCGRPGIVNTSFNVRDEPIVCTPDNAYRCSMKTKMDVLALGSFLVVKAAGAPAGGPSRTADAVAHV